MNEWSSVAGVIVPGHCCDMEAGDRVQVIGVGVGTYNPHVTRCIKHGAAPEQLLSPCTNDRPTMHEQG